MKIFTTIFALIVSFGLHSQVFEKGMIQNLVKRGADHIYNANPDSSNYYIAQVEELIPDHPVVPLMKAMTLLWSTIPTISEETFTVMERQLDSAIYLAKKIDPDLKQPEMIFFAMSAHGLLAEYYADQDYNVKAVGEANRAYGLLKEGFDLVEEYPEFLFTTGLYNYFREKYPEKHPLYKPLLWFFRSGDLELGLRQLEMATEKTFLTKVEAHVYLSYIYLRYEYKPKKAQEYLSQLCEMYPNNFYAKAKYLESLANPTDFKEVSMMMLYSLITHENDYYKLAGYVFLGYYEEIVIQNKEKAEVAYRKALSYANDLPNHGEYFKGFGYLGLGRILVEKEQNDEARESLNQAIKWAETDLIKEEAKALLSRI